MRSRKRKKERKRKNATQRGEISQSNCRKRRCEELNGIQITPDIRTETTHVGEVQETHVVLALCSDSRDVVSDKRGPQRTWQGVVIEGVEGQTFGVQRCDLESKVIIET